MKHLRLADSFTVPAEAVTQTFAFLGKRGVGKTHTMAVLVEELFGIGAHVVVADPIGVFWGLRAAADGKGPGLPILVMGGDHGDVPLEVTAGELVADLVVDEQLSVVLDLSRFRKGEQTRFMEVFAERLYHRNRAPLHLVLDEADAFAPQRPVPGEQRLLGAIEDLVRRGRARGIGVSLATQRAAVLNKNVLTQVEVLVALRLIAPQDRRAVEAWIEVHGTPEQQQKLMASLPSLPVGTAWFWSPGWLDIFKQVQVRRRRTFDSSATPKMGARVVAPRQLAPVDLEAITVRMAETVERAKANDPKELRRQVAELQRQLAQKPAAPAAPAKTVEVSVLKDAHVKALDGLVARMQKAVTGVQAAAAVVDAQARQIVDAIAAVRAARPVPSSAGGGPIAAKAERPMPLPNRPAPVVPARAGGEQLGRGERQVLGAIAQHGTAGVTREQLCVLTGFKRSSRDTYLQRLRAGGLVAQGSNGQLFATPEGAAALGPSFELLPTGSALRSHWLERLPEGERRVLQVLVAAWPDAARREAIDEQTGYRRSSRDTYLQRLSARKLIEVRDRGEVRVVDDLFDGGERRG